MIKTIFLLIFFILVQSVAICQSYTQYMQQGKSHYNKASYMTALERFDLAFEIATNNTNKSEARLWKNKCKKQIKDQQIRVQKIMKALLPVGVENTYTYFKNLGDQFYERGEYKEALKNYKIAEIAAQSHENKSYVKTKKLTIEKLIKDKANGIKFIRNKEYFKAFELFENICKINPTDYSSISYKAL